MRKIHLLYAAICVIATLPAPAKAQFGGDVDVHAKAIIRVSSNTHTFEVKTGMVQFLISQTDWPSGENDGKVRMFFTPLPGGRRGSVIGYLGVSGPGKVTDELLKTIRDRLQNILSKLADASLGPFNLALKSAERRAEMAHDRVEMLNRVVQEDHNRLLHKGIVPEKLDEQIAKLDSERFSLEVELAGLRASHEALMPHIASAGKELEKAKAEAFASLRPLEKAVAIRAEKAVALRSVYKRETIGLTKVLDAEAEVLMTKAELGERRRSIAEEHGGGLLESLNERAIEVEIERKSIEARLDVICKRMAQFQNDDTFKLIGSYRKNTRHLEEAQRWIKVAVDKMADLESQRSRMQLPRVQILSLDELLKQKK